MLNRLDGTRVRMTRWCSSLFARAAPLRSLDAAGNPRFNNRLIFVKDNL
jgi:hypothetical protein